MSARRLIDPLREFQGRLVALENPARYLGGEFGQTRKYPDAADFVMGIGFPDVYEIGMSNTAIKLIYALANRVEGVACERVFSPWFDFEELLRARSLPLYTLESGIALRDLDLLGLSIGFELSLSNALAMIDLGGIPLLAAERGEGDPLVVAGGPVTSNPAPYGPFCDGVVIGEAEACLPGLLAELRRLKRAGARRADLVAALEDHPAVWSEAKAARGGGARRAVWREFAASARSPEFPVPGAKIIQDYASLEIMRGCPQGCRFCHAGIFYRPYRQKPMELIAREVAGFVCGAGYREVSLASLSSGDYPDVASLYRQLNAAWGPYGVSFAMPSLKVNSFTLPLLAEMAQGKKSGLTFAVETGSALGQLGLNKQAGLDATLAIMREAKALGWKSAKLYFMVGLPVPGQDDEAAAIAAYLAEVRRAVGINLNVTCGTFVPKPHTAFQWAPQIDPDKAWRLMDALKSENRDRGVNISYQTPFYSYLEGIVSRGDRRAGLLALDAYRRGARFDGWDDRIRRDLWQAAIAEADWDVKATVCGGYATDARLPWEGIKIGVGAGFLRREWERSQAGELTPRCAVECGEPCGACGPAAGVDDAAQGQAAARVEAVPPAGWTGPRLASADGDERELPGMLFGFAKRGTAAFLPHLGLAQVLERALMRSGLPFRLSPGFHPHPVMELSQALSLGLESEEELCLIQLHAPVGEAEFAARLAPQLPPGLVPTRALSVPSLIGGRKRPSLGALFAGATYRVALPAEGAEAALAALAGAGAVPVGAEGGDPPGYSLSLSAGAGPSSLRQLFEPVLGPDWQAAGIRGRRTCLLARREAVGEHPAVEGDYFTVFSELARTGW